MDLGIAGRKALVTGGSLGIGRACADLLVAEGVDVAIAARNEERLGAVASDIASGTNARVIPIAGDLSVASDTERVVAEAAEALLAKVQASE